MNKVSIGGKIKCLCLSCNNILNQSLDDVLDNLICTGIYPSDTCWYHHGEATLSSHCVNEAISIRLNQQNIPIAWYLLDS